MIKYNNSTINDWYFDDANIIKIYRNGVVCYYKVTGGGDTPTAQTPCYAVVDDISQYQETEFVNVYNKADSSWYKLNNNSLYEKYGVYGEGRNITYYQGKLTIDDGYEYIYSGSSWVNVGEVSGGTATLPDVAFTVNYNAKNYDANTKTLAKTSGQLADVDAVITAGTPTVHDGYLTIASNTRATISGYSTYFNRDSSNPNMTIVSKQRTDGNNCHMFANRNNNYNWMYRCYSNKLTLHGGSETGQIAVSTQPVIESVRVNSTSPMLTYNNYTDGTSSTTASFSYGSRNSGKFAMFQGYATNTGEYFVGDFYWVYMSQNTLTDEQVQQVITFNEGGSTTVYPMYYDEIQDPPTLLVFETMEEALAYPCPYVGVFASIGGTMYKFNDEYKWEELAFTITGVTTSSSSFNIKINDTDQAVQIWQDNGDGTYNWGVVYLNPITSSSAICSGNTSLKTFDWGDADISGMTKVGNNAFYNCNAMTTSLNDLMPSGITEIGNYAFDNCSSQSGASIVIPSGVTLIGTSAFYGALKVNSSNNSITIPSSVTTIYSAAFASNSQIRNIYIEDLESWFNCYLSGNDSAPWYSSSYKNVYFNNTLMTNLTIPSSVTNLNKNSLFYSLTTLTGLTIPSTVASISGHRIFAYSGVKEVTIPSSVTYWTGQEMFSNCRSLSSATINCTNSGIPSGTFYYCDNLKTVNIGSNVTNIGYNAFRTCNKLSAVTIPSSVTSIGDYAFDGDSALTAVTMESTTPPSLGGNKAFPSGTTIYVPCSSVSTYRTASVWSNWASNIVGYESCTTYSWQVVSGDYMCSEGDKYEKEQYMRSFDGGTTWEAVTPAQYRMGSLIESGSTDCASRLPSGYQEVEYIENTASGSNISLSTILSLQYADQRTDDASAYTYTIVYEPTNLSNDYNNLFGNQWIELQILGGSHKRNVGRFAGYYQDGNTNELAVGRKVQAKIYWNSGESYPKMELTNITASTTTTTTLSKTRGGMANFYPRVGLFNFYSEQDSGAKFARAKIYEAKVEDRQGNLLAHGIPCVRTSDNKCGFYNLARNEFEYDASGNLTLTAGPNVT